MAKTKVLSEGGFRVYRAMAWRSPRVDKYPTGVVIEQVVQTPQGFVVAQSSRIQRQSGITEDTSLHFIWQGIRHNRYLNAFHNERYLVTLARRFAAEIAAGEQSK